MSFLLGPGLLVDATVDGSEIRRTTWDVKDPVNIGMSYQTATQADLFYIPAFFSVLFWIGDLEAPET